MAFIYDFTATWDDAGVVWNGIKLDVDTTGGYDSTSRLLLLQADGIDIFGVAADGTIDTSHQFTNVVTLDDGVVNGVTLADDQGTSSFLDGSGAYQAGILIPSGGTAGQVLAKASGSDYDVEWVDP
jgi:hypothetical protein